MKRLENRVAKKIGRALMEYDMIAPGDRVLVAVSGGKDSLTMAYHLIHKQKKFPFPFEIHALHIQSDFDGCTVPSFLKNLLDEWGLESTFLPVPIKARLKEGQSLNCYWCSTQRRLELMRFAQENGYNKIALGHHQDDILQTFFMNFVCKAEMSTMLPVMKYDKFPQTVIRPLAWVSEAEIIEFASRRGFLCAATSCPWGTTSRRKDAKQWIERIAQDVPGARDKMFRGLHNPVDKYLPKAVNKRMNTQTKKDE